MKTGIQWIITADERRAVLFSAQQVAGARWRLEEHRSIANQWEDYHEHHRPSWLGRGPTANAAQHFASTGHEKQEEHQRFAREVAQWLRSSVPGPMDGLCHLFAPPRFLGLLRPEFAGAADAPDLHEAELNRLSPAELAEHPTVLGALKGHPASR